MHNSLKEAYQVARPVKQSSGFVDHSMTKWLTQRVMEFEVLCGWAGKNSLVKYRLFVEETVYSYGKNYLQESIK